MSKTITAMIGLIMIVSLTACGTAQSGSSQQHKDAMKGMSMKNGHQGSLSKAFQDELKGLTSIEQEMKQADYKSATSVANQLHDEFHVRILPSLKAKKGADYAEKVHGKYDELQDAIMSKDRTKIKELIKVNRENLKTVAKILNVPLK